jgi:anti-anti-sigma factor
MDNSSSKDPTDRRQDDSDWPLREFDRRSAISREPEISVERKSPAHAILHVANELVAQNHYMLDEALERVGPCRRGFVLELEISRVPYADSEAMGRLFSWSKRMHQAGAQFIISNPSPYVTSIFQMLHLDEVLTIVHRHAAEDEQEP